MREMRPAWIIWMLIHAVLMFLCIHLCGVDTVGMVSTCTMLWSQSVLWIKLWLAKKEFQWIACMRWDRSRCLAMVGCCSGGTLEDPPSLSLGSFVVIWVCFLNSDLILFWAKACEYFWPAKLWYQSLQYYYILLGEWFGSSFSLFHRRDDFCLWKRRDFPSLAHELLETILPIVAGPARRPCVSFCYFLQWMKAFWLRILTLGHLRLNPGSHMSSNQIIRLSTSIGVIRKLPPSSAIMIYLMLTTLIVLFLSMYNAVAFPFWKNLPLTM